MAPAFSLFGLEGSGINNNVFHELPETLTQKNMPLSADHIVIKRDWIKCPHLAKLEMPECRKG